MISALSKLAIMATLMATMDIGHGSTNLRKKLAEKDNEDSVHYDVEEAYPQHNAIELEMGEDENEMVNGETQYDLLKRELGEDESEHEYGESARKNTQRNTGVIGITWSSTKKRRKTTTTTTTTTTQTPSYSNGNNGLEYCWQSEDGRPWGSMTFDCGWGAKPNQQIFIGGKQYRNADGTSIFGTCQTMHPCLCGIAPGRMAQRCPCQCREYCGGKCATLHHCPNGFAVTPDGKAVPGFDYSSVKDDDPTGRGRWPYYLGLPACRKEVPPPFVN